MFIFNCFNSIHMKKIIFIFLLIVSITKAQNNTVPQFISYQGVARNASGTVLVSSTIAVRFTIFNKTTSALVYSESYTGSTGLICNSVGIFNASIGSLNPTSFQAINWASDPYEIHVEIDIANGTSFVYLGTQDFKTVPYAFHSADGVLWKGNFSIAPTVTPIAGSVYRNRISGVTYYRTGSLWDTLAFTAGGSMPLGTVNTTLWHNGINWAVTNKFFIDGGNKLKIGTSSTTHASAVVDIEDSLHGMLIPRMSYNKRMAITSPAHGLLVFQINNDILSTSPRGFYYYDGTIASWAWIAPYNTSTSPWLRNLIGINNNVFLGNPSDDVSIGLSSGIFANEKLHLHNSSGNAFMQFTTFSTSNNVGLVFGVTSSAKKGALTFDNTFNELTYLVLGNRAFVIKNDRSTYFGKVPIGFFNSSAMSVIDSTTVGAVRPSLNVFNKTLNEPAILQLGDNAGSGVNLTFIKGTPNVFALKDITSSNPFTFNANGNFYPGSDGTPGQAYIKAGPTVSSPLILQSASTNSTIINVGYTQLGNNGAQFPAIQVLEFNSTMPTSASSNVQISLSSYISTSNRIVSVQIFVSTSSRVVPPNFNLSMFAGLEYQYDIGTSIPIIFIWTTPGNSYNLYGQPVRVLVTIKK
jgi:hypothetical protein